MQEKDPIFSYNLLCIITGCGGGDWPPLLSLAEGLAKAGHDLLVVCDNSTLQAVESCDLPTLCLQPTLDLASVFEPALARLMSRDKAFLQSGDTPLKTWGDVSGDTILSELEDWCPALIITSLLGVGMGERLSNSLSTPWCFLNPSFYFSDSLNYNWDKDFSEMGVYMYRSWIWPLAQTADLVLHATLQEFDECPEVLPAHHHYIGPLFWERQEEVEKPPKNPGVPSVLIAVSTSPQPGDLNIVRSALQALKTMDLPALVTLSPEHNQDDIGAVPPKVRVIGYTPHSTILPGCSLVISHAGHGIVMKSMAYGVPMVLVPWGRDQPGVAIRARRLGTAVVVSKSECSDQALSDAIKEILDNPVYQQNSKQISARFRYYNGRALAVQSIERFFLGI